MHSAAYFSTSGAIPSYSGLHGWDYGATIPCIARARTAELHKHDPPIEPARYSGIPNEDFHIRNAHDVAGGILVVHIHRGSRETVACFDTTFRMRRSYAIYRLSRVQPVT